MPGPYPTTTRGPTGAAHVAAAVAEIEAVGGSVVRPPEFCRPDGTDLLEWAVMSDPFGKSFCLVRWPLE